MQCYSNFAFLVQAASRNDLEGLLSVVESAGESFDDMAVESALRQVSAGALPQDVTETPAVTTLG